MDHLLPFFLFAVVTTLTPGPNNFMLMNSGMNYGVKRTMPHMMGVALGFPIMFIAMSLGFNVIFVQFPALKHLLKLAGTGYLLYLAYKIMYSPSNLQDDPEGDPMSFLQALLFQWVNPKGLLMAFSAISIYTVSAHYMRSVIEMSILFFLVCIPCAGIWMVMGAKVKDYLTSDLHRKIFNFAMAAGLIASVGMIFFD